MEGGDVYIIGGRRLNDAKEVRSWNRPNSSYHG